MKKLVKCKKKEKKKLYLVFLGLQVALLTRLLCWWGGCTPRRNYSWTLTLSCGGQWPGTTSWLDWFCSRLRGRGSRGCGLRRNGERQGWLGSTPLSRTDWLRLWCLSHLRVAESLRLGRGRLGLGRWRCRHIGSRTGCLTAPFAGRLHRRVGRAWWRGRGLRGVLCGAGAGGKVLLEGFRWFGVVRPRSIVARPHKAIARATIVAAKTIAIWRKGQVSAVLVTTSITVQGRADRA